MKLAHCLMAFGAPSHRIESQLVAAARILEVDAEFIHLPNLIIVCFGDPETKTSETHFLRCSGLAFWLSALICPLAFGGSFLDMFVAGSGAFVLSTLQLTVVMKSALYANVFE